jgi:hypothetical protein
MLDATTYALDEWAGVVADYAELETAALNQFLSLKANQRDTSRQLILFPIQAMGNIYRLYQAVAMNRQLYKEKNPDCNIWADRAEQAFRRDSVLCAQYNNDIAGGKWNGMMVQKHIGYRSWNDDFGPKDIMPQVFRINEKTGNNLFAEQDGIVAIEAEHFFDRHDGDGLRWTVIPDMGRTLSGISLQPYNVALKPSGNPTLTYRFSTENAVKGVYVVVKSTLDFQNKGGHCFRVTIDGKEPVVCNFNKDLNEKPENIYSLYYPTVARRVVVANADLQASAGQHTLVIEPLDPAIVFEKVVVDCGGYRPSFLFGQESPRTQE